MRRPGLINAAALCVALAGAALAIMPLGAVGGPPAVAMRSDDGRHLVTLPDGRQAVLDARGTPVPLGSYRRIASLDILSGELLLELAEPERIAALSIYNQSPSPWRMPERPKLQGLNDLEGILALKPDLVLVATFGGDLERIQRLREAGVAVCDLGPTGGLDVLMPNIRRIGLLLGAPERGEDLARRLGLRLSRVAATLPPGRRRLSALALTPVVDKVYGGTTGASFHDVLDAAGLVDAAAGLYAEPWPLLPVEDLLRLDPDRIVTRQGGGAELRRIPGLAGMRALRDPHGIIEIPVALFDSPGPGMLDAAEAVFAAAYPATP